MRAPGERESEMNRANVAWIGVLAGALTIVGAVGPWATVANQSFAGTDANRGVTVAVAAGVGLLLMALAAWKRLAWAAGLAAVAGLIAFGLTIWTFAAIGSFIDAPEGFPVGRGWGIWLALVGSIVLVVAAFAATFARDQNAAVELPSDSPAS
jgi:hypothetical protein